MEIKNRNIVTQVIITIVSCGFYGWYWRFMMAKEAVSFGDPEDQGTLEAILYMFPLTCFIGAYLIEKKFATGFEARGIEHKDNSILYLVVGLLLPIVVDCLLQNELNKLAPEEAE